jgi:hypothetical protein
MPMHDEDGKQPDTSQGYELTDASVRDVTVFLTALGVFTVVLFVFCFGMGKLINNAIVKRDGPLNKWNATGIKAPGKRQDMTSDPAMEQVELNQMTQRFPTPRLQMDDGDQDVADLHAREDLLLDHYSWINRQQGKVRIPIERAMELLVKSGLPVAPQTQAQPLMTGDKPVVVPAPLTDGFARTAHEQQVLETMQQQRLRGETPTNQASLGANH